MPRPHTVRPEGPSEIGVHDGLSYSVWHGRELGALTRSPHCRLIAVPGGDHHSVQHDPDLQAVSVRFIERGLAAPPA